MSKRPSRNKKALTVTMSVMFVATAFQAPGGCNVTLDENLLQQIMGNVEGSGGGFVEGHFGGGGEEYWEECDGSYEGWDGGHDDWDDHSDDSDDHTDDGSV